MTSISTTASPTFSDVVKEAFIDPIRSVLIIDDQYPTWEEILNDEISPITDQQARLQDRSKNKKWRNDPSRPLNIIKGFRRRKPALIVDIHDAAKIPISSDGGSKVGEDPGQSEQPDELAKYLHQSDFLVLDYNLEGSAAGTGGALAREILSSVLHNQHFNLIIVHTEEDLPTTSIDCVLSLLTRCSETFSSSENQLIKDLTPKLEELQDEEKFNPAERNDLLDKDTYLKLRQPGNSCAMSMRQYMRSEGILGRLGERAKEIGLTGKELRAFAFWAIKDFEDSHSELLASEGSQGVNWCLDTEPRWLRTSRGFVGFADKNEQDLLDQLQLAIEAWQPTPSRLLSAKFRDEISCNGVAAEDLALLKRHVYAQSYKEILTAGSDRERASRFEEQIARQVENLASQITEDVARFGEKIFCADTNAPDGFSKHYSVDLNDPTESALAKAHYNCHVSTLPPNDNAPHLDCGHIFQKDNDYWLCATPTCDMQPDQNSIAFLGTSSELRPFTALQLVPVEIEKLTVAQINSGRFCFVRTATEKIQALGLEVIAADGAEPEPTSKVTWRLFLATSDGKLTGSVLEYFDLKLNENTLEQALQTAQIVAKLRSEYALNYLQRVGESVTRIGLGYIT